MSARNMPTDVRDNNLTREMNIPVNTSIVQYLNSVDHVVKFQKYFGVLPKTPKYPANNNNNTNIRTNNNNNNNSNSNSKKNSFCNKNNPEITTSILAYDGSSHESVIIESISWYYFFRAMSSLANETFITLLFAYLFWNFDNTIARQLILAWVCVMFPGQLLKDILKIPRPASPPVVVFESNYANEYGVPSTHAVGACIPMVMAFLLNKRFQIPIVPMFIASILWCIPICLSRLYLGMHTILDILSGLLLTSVILSLLLPLLDHLDLMILTCPQWIYISVASTTLLAYMYPNPLLYSPTRGDSCTSLGAFSGMTIGSWINYRYLGSKIILGTIYSSYYDEEFSFGTLAELANIAMIQSTRCLIGIFVVLVGREILNKSIYKALCWLFSLDPKDRLSKYDKKVEIPLKLIVYTFVGAALSCISPFVMSMFNI